MMNAAEFAKRYGLSEHNVAAVQEKIKANDVRLLAMSGKLGAGKDTIAPLIMDKLESNGFIGKRIHESFAHPLRDEINEIIKCINDSEFSLNDGKTPYRYVQLKMSVTADVARKIVDILKDDVVSGAVKSSSDRTPSMRLALQYWGTDVRRGSDLDYWVKRAMKTIVGHLLDDDDVFITDARFPNEIGAILGLGGTTVRLDISEAEQSRRIELRDGNEVTEEMRRHPSETALDDYNGFTAIVHSDGLSIEQTVDKVYEELGH